MMWLVAVALPAMAFVFGITGVERAVLIVSGVMAAGFAGVIDELHAWRGGWKH